MKLKRIYPDDPLLPKFMEECAEMGYKNNTTIKDLKFDYFEEIAFFGIIEEVDGVERILCFNGVHNFELNDEQYYRIGFRGATVYAKNGYKPKFTKDIIKSSINIYGLMAYEILFAEENFKHKDAKFIMTSNSPTGVNDQAGKSFLVDRLSEKGLIPGMTLLYRNVEYLYTMQNVWLVDRNILINNFEKYHRNNLNIC